MQLSTEQKVEWTRNLAEFVSVKSFDTIPTEVIEQTKRIILDTLGCALGGYTQAKKEVNWITKYAKGQCADGVATIFCDGAKTSTSYAAFVNGAMAHTIDFDDTHMGSVTHLGSPLLATTFALGEQQQSSGKDVIEAFVLGFEVAARIGRGMMPSHYKYWHPTATFGAIGAAVAAAKLLKLNASQIEEVIGLAADAAGGLRYGVENGDFSKTLHPAMAAMKAIIFAELVNIGANGPRGILEYPSGFFNAFSEQPEFSPLLYKLGETYEVMADSIKSFPTIQCSHAAITTTLELVEKHQLRMDKIEEVNVLHTATVPGQGCNYSPENPLAARLSIPFCISLGIKEGRVTLEKFTQEKMSEPEIKQFMPKVKIKASEEFAVKYPDTIAAFVDIKTTDGREYSGSEIYPKGDPRNRMTNSEIKDKFRTLGLNTFNPNQVERIISSVLELDKIENIRNVTRDLGRG